MHTAAVDGGLIHRVPVNLAGNAITYSPRFAAIDARMAATATTARVAITDPRPGICAKFHERVFGTCGQVEPRTSLPGRSTGLGLTFCQLAVAAQGGDIGVQGEVGRGRTLWVTRPLGRAEARPNPDGLPLRATVEATPCAPDVRVQ